MIAKRTTKAKKTKSAEPASSHFSAVHMPAPRRHSTAANPRFSTSVSSLSEAPDGCLSPRSHLLTGLLVT